MRPQKWRLTLGVDKVKATYARCSVGYNYGTPEKSGARHLA